MCLLQLVSLACTTTTVDQSESRKTSIRSPSAAVGSSNHLNSLQSSQDSIGKQPMQQSQQNINGQNSYRVTTPEFTSITQQNVPHSLYTQMQTGQSAPSTGGYFFSVNPQNSQTAALGGGKSYKNMENFMDFLTSNGVFFFFL